MSKITIDWWAKIEWTYEWKFEIGLCLIYIDGCVNKKENHTYS